MITTLFFNTRKRRQKSLPKILKKQISTINYLISTFCIIDLIQLFPFNLSQNSPGRFASIGIANIIITYVFLYSSKKIMGLRFLNSCNHVQSDIKFNFINDFKNILEQLSSVTLEQELIEITQQFFKQAFGIASSFLHIRFLDHSSNYQMSNERVLSTEHTIISYIQNEDFIKQLKQHMLLIYDEIVFSNFYDENAYDQTIIECMNDVHADILLPIFEKEKLLGYIIVYKNARNNQLYNKVEQDEMIIFGSYLSNIINVLQNRNLDTIIQQKVIQDELHNKHQETLQYKEAIRSFFRLTQRRKFGIIFYKNKRFSFGNKEAKELIKINLNLNETHYFSKACKKLISYVEKSKASHAISVQDELNHELTLTCLPYIDKDAFLITVLYAENSTNIQKHFAMLNEPSTIDYLLYLETTKVGQIINLLLPGNEPYIQHCKIELLKILYKPALLVSHSCQDDLYEIVEILQHLHLKQLYSISLYPDRKEENAITLFGIEQIFQTDNQPGMLHQLNNTGTLFIQNIEYLSIEAQRNLAMFIKYGFYTKYKGYQKFMSNVPIICSTNQQLSTLVQKNEFAPELFNVLTNITVPTIRAHPKNICDLHEYGNKLSTLTAVFDIIMQHNACTNLQDLKKHIIKTLEHTLKQNNVSEHTIYKSDPELASIAQLGKQALRHVDIMHMLWKKFKNQNKIATFLGVNPSSVNRRYKKYNLMEHS